MAFIGAGGGGGGAGKPNGGAAVGLPTTFRSCKSVTEAYTVIKEVCDEAFASVHTHTREASGNEKVFSVEVTKILCKRKIYHEMEVQILDVTTGRLNRIDLVLHVDPNTNSWKRVLVEFKQVKHWGNPAVENGYSRAIAQLRLYSHIATSQHGYHIGGCALVNFPTNWHSTQIFNDVVPLVDRGEVDDASISSNSDEDEDESKKIFNDVVPLVDRGEVDDASISSNSDEDEDESKNDNNNESHGSPDASNPGATRKYMCGNCKNSRHTCTASTSRTCTWPCVMGKCKTDNRRKHMAKDCPYRDERNSGKRKARGGKRQKR